MPRENHNFYCMTPNIWSPNDTQSIKYGSSFLWYFKLIAQISKVQNNIMKSLSGFYKNVSIAALLGDMGWLRMECPCCCTHGRYWMISNFIITQIICISFFLRLNEMLWNWLNHVIFKESCYLAENTPPTERYVVDIRTVERKKMMAGLRMGCLPLAVESGRYTPLLSDSMFSVLPGARNSCDPCGDLCSDSAPVCPDIRRFSLLEQHWSLQPMKQLASVLTWLHDQTLMLPNQVD